MNDALFDQWINGLPEGHDGALVDRVTDAFGVEPSRRLVHLLRRLEAALETELPIHLTPPSWWSLDAPNLFEAALGQPLRVIAATTGSLPIGSDTAGCEYFVRVHPEHDEVALYDPAIGELQRVADSLASFAGMLRFQELWATLEEAGTVDTEAAIEGEVDRTAPELEEVSSLLDALEGHLHLPDTGDTDIFADPLELLLGLYGGPREASCALADEFRPTEPLLVLLTHGGFAPPPEPTGDPSLARLLGAFFRLDDAGFEKERAAHVRHPARFVRDAAAFLGELVAGERPAHRDLSILRTWVREEPPRGTKTAPKELVDAVPEARRPATIDSAGAWDTATYTCFAEKDFESMLACSAVSIALDPTGYYGWLQKAIALQSLERRDEAIDAYHHGLCYSEHSHLLVNLALTWVELGEPATVKAVLARLTPEAREEFTRTIDELKPFAD